MPATASRWISCPAPVPADQPCPGLYLVGQDCEPDEVGSGPAFVSYWQSAQGCFRSTGFGDAIRWSRLASAPTREEGRRFGFVVPRARKAVAK